MKHTEIRDMNRQWREYRLDETLNEENESLWTWIYKGFLGGFRKAEKNGTVTLDEVARGVAFLIKTEYGGHAKNDFIKSLKKYIR
mgnify:CR=1 FL=1|jgi:hypothetical protein|tara:strand:+ start:711 stop:965 length:255 start_codon:yes stop_codon:yes gene_type:complete